MLEWTGERFLPWRKDPALAYEHLHRYLYASQLAAGKTVLDLASGEGYGSNLLAANALRVVGIDIDANAVEHARLRYERQNLEFIEGSATAVPVNGNNVFDLVVCFEAIEHIEDQELLLNEVGRLLKADGIFIVSTPNKSIYDASIQEENEFHVRELDFEEFKALMEKHFKHVGFLGQRLYAESNLWPISADEQSPFSEFVVERLGTEFETIPGSQRVPMYYVAAASNVPLADLPASGLLDAGNELLAEKDRAIAELLATKASQEESLTWREEQISERDKSLGWYEEETRKLRGEVDTVKGEMDRLAALLCAETETHEREVAQLSKENLNFSAVIAANKEALAWRAGQVELLENEKSVTLRILGDTQTQLRSATNDLETIRQSTGWKLVLKVCRYRDAVFPTGSSRRRLLERFLRSLS